MRSCFGSLLAGPARPPAAPRSRRTRPARAAVVGHYKVGQPYQIKGRWYRPEYDPSYARVGTASWYGADFHGLPTANGEVFDKEQISAAHPTLPLPSIVRVTNLENGRSLDMRVNDRGPFVERPADRPVARRPPASSATRGRGWPGCGWSSWRWPTTRAARRPRRPWPPADAEPRDRIAAAGAAGPSATGTVQLAAREVQPAATRRRRPRPPAACAAGGRSWSRSAPSARPTRCSAAMATVEGLEQVRVEPAFAGGTRAVARVRLGPVADPRRAAARCWSGSWRLGYTDAFMVPASGTGRAASLAELLSPLGSTASDEVRRCDCGWSCSWSCCARAGRHGPGAGVRDRGQGGDHPRQPHRCRSCSRRTPTSGCRRPP